MYFYHLSYDFLWVDKSVVMNGWGSQLLHKIEEIAKKRVAEFILLDSF